MNTSSPESATVSQASKPADLEHAADAAVNPTASPSNPPHRPPRPYPSKISTLPPELRELVNESLYNLVPHKKIIQILADKGHPGINKVNLTKWSKTGYQLWLQERQRFNCLRLKMDDADKHFRHLNADDNNRANYINGVLIDLHMAQIMRDFDPDLIKQQLQKDPMAFFKFVRATHTRSLDRQRDDRIKLQREKLGIGVETGPTEAGRQAVKQMLNLPDCWIPPSNKPLTQVSPN